MAVAIRGFAGAVPWTPEARMRTVAKWLVRAGLGVWLVGLVAAVFGVWVTLPPDATKWLVLGLALTSGAVLVLSGMALGRGAPRRGLGGVTEWAAVGEGLPGTAETSDRPQPSTRAVRS